MWGWTGFWQHGREEGERGWEKGEKSGWEQGEAVILKSARSIPGTEKVLSQALVSMTREKGTL